VKYNPKIELFIQNLFVAYLYKTTLQYNIIMSSYKFIRAI